MNCQKYTKKGSRIFNFICICFLSFLMIIFLFFLFNSGLTGKTTLSIENSDFSEEFISGNLRLTLQPGEFIPADTKVIINNEEFILRNLIKEISKQGEFYISGADISGFGEGYGSENPEVFFTMNILSEEKEITEEIQADNSAEPAIIGAVILNFFSKIFLTITGKTALENINEIQGKVSRDKPFIYALEQGQTAEIKDSDKNVNLEIINNTATITTDYSGEEIEYLINLSELNIPVSQKDLEIKLIYNETELYSFKKNLNFEILNETNQTIQEINLTFDESLVQYGAVLGEPVKWKKKIIADSQETIVELPKEAENISIYKINELIADLNNSVAENLTSLTTGNIILEYKSSKKSFFYKISQFFTGRVIDVTEKTEKIEINISENNGEYDIEYITPGPIAFEKNTSVGKEVVISSEVHYENILAYTTLPNNTNLEEIKLYHIINGSTPDGVSSGEVRILVDFVAYNENGE